MADTTASQVTIIRSWTENGTNGKNRIGMLAQIALATQGSATNKILATSFGLTKIENVQGVVKPQGANNVLLLAPSDSGEYIFLYNPAGVTTPFDDPVDSVEVLIIEIHGY